MKGTLDLDSIDTWHSDFSALLYASDMWRQVETRIKNSGDSEFLPALTYTKDRLDDLTRPIRLKAEEILSTRYTSVIAYHGCRPKDPDSYRTKGILPSEPSILIETARGLFDGLHGLEEAINEVCSNTYIAHVKARIWLYFSGLRARHPNESHRNGSELIRSIATRLGREAEERFEETGKPTLIKCSIPLERLAEYEDSSVVSIYAGKIIEGLIRKQLWPKEEPTGFQGGYYLTRIIPSENIVGFIDVSG